MSFSYFDRLFLWVITLTQSPFFVMGDQSLPHGHEHGPAHICKNEPDLDRTVTLDVARAEKSRCSSAG